MCILRIRRVRKIHIENEISRRGSGNGPARGVCIDWPLEDHPWNRLYKEEELRGNKSYH